MSYCHNCGLKVAQEDLFCASCGTSLDFEEKQKSKSNSCSTHRYGYLFTNLESLGHKLNTPLETLRSFLQSFIYEKSETGVIYKLIDVSNYTPLLSENRSLGSSITLTPVDSWESHQRLLTDQYVYDSQRENTADYLFIIGGDDIIPMPKIKHYIYAPDPGIYTDMPYGYLYGSKTLSLFENEEVFKHSSMLHVGRLPFAEDSDIDFLTSYLRRAIHVSRYGLSVRGAYGQCDPHWKNVSNMVIKELYDAKLMPTYEGVGEDSVYRSLVLSPSVNLETIQSFFHPGVSLYYFNMHGSNSPQNGCFSGEIPRGSKKHVNGISPKEWNSCEENNIVITEACYGARFIGDSYEHSMLLSSLHNKTLLYVGSSHIAFGAVDPYVGMSNADIIARCFMGAFLRGYDGANSLFFAKQAIFSQGDVNKHDLTTVVEFGIFGDPTLAIYGSHEMGADHGAKSTTSKSHTPLTTEEEYSKPIMKVISVSSSSILNRVRQAVNRNILEGNKKVGEYLYHQLGITPREADQIFEVTTKQGCSYFYKYTMSESNEIWVKLDSKNNITEVITTK